MNTRLRCGFVMGFTLLLVGTNPLAARAVSPSFTYQGQLRQGGDPVNGTCDFEFRLFDAPVGGTQLGSTQPAANFIVIDGLVTVPLLFGGDPFNGQDRYLEIRVRCPDGSGPYTTLDPRQMLTAAPYALYAPSAGSAGDLSCTGCIDTTALANSAVTSSKIASGAIQASNLAFTPGTVTSITAGAGLLGGTITSVGTLEANFGTTPGTVAAGNHVHDTLYWRITGNAGTTAGTSFLGTTDNQALDLRVNNTRALRLLPGASPSLIGGLSSNSVDAGAQGVVIAGGGDASAAPGAGPNRVRDNHGTVGGGFNNQVGNMNADPADAFGATIAGGGGNTASAQGATICGGGGNQAAGTYATVAGGVFNSAGGEHATVPGGSGNFASAIGSFAAGRLAAANHDGSFVWGDGTAIASSQGPYTFNVLATGGMRFYFDAAGHHCDLTSTAGWNCAGASDRNAKSNVAAVDGRDVLDRLSALPIQRWSYRSQDPAVRHIGPMAQDFHAAFQVGEDDTHINTVDADGVAFAAIQGLYELVREKQSQIAEQQKTILALQEQNARLQVRMMAVEQHMAVLMDGWVATAPQIAAGRE